MGIFRKSGSLAITLFALTTTATAQDKVKANISADLVNQYIWRGQYLGGVSVQPTLGLSYKGLSLTAWGSAELDKEVGTKELDFTLGYTFKGFNVGITDYWIGRSGDKYFKYSAHETCHVFEANIGYDFGPVALQWYTNFAGADGCDKDGDRAYSSYVEADVPFRLGGLDWTAALGAVPYATTSYSKANGFAVTNVSLKASKDINITKSFSVPLFAAIATNPSTQKAYFVCGFTLQP